MSLTTLSQSEPVARKPHGCVECGGTIGAGDRYERQNNTDGRDLWTYKAHRLCFALAFRDHWDDGEPCWEAMWDDLREWFSNLARYLAGEVDRAQ